eukprot:scaffold602_cov298-Pinguiococcus_pyrenoidosus.AAC.29
MPHRALADADHVVHGGGAGDRFYSVSKRRASSKDVFYYLGAVEVYPFQQNVGLTVWQLRRYARARASFSRKKGPENRQEQVWRSSSRLIHSTQGRKPGARRSVLCIRGDQQVVHVVKRLSPPWRLERSRGRGDVRAQVLSERSAGFRRRALREAVRPHLRQRSQHGHVSLREWIAAGQVSAHSKQKAAGELAARAAPSARRIRPS